jgi:hypothetical protein
MKMSIVHINCVCTLTSFPIQTKPNIGGQENMIENETSSANARRSGVRCHPGFCGFQLHWHAYPVWLLFTILANYLIP